MRTAILTPTFSGFSGPDRVAWNEVEELSKKSEVAVFCFRADMKHPKARIIVLGAPKSPTLERIYKLLFFLDIPKLARIVKELKKYNSVISFLYPMTVPAALAKALYRKHYTYYDVGLAYPKLFRSFTERVAIHFQKLLTKITVANADDAVSISKFCGEELKKLTGLQSKVRYVAIDKKRFNKSINKNKIAAVKKKYGLTKPTLLYIGRISPHKGIHLLLQAFNIVKKEFPKAKLLIVGKHTFGKYSQELKKISSSSVVFTGFIPDEELPYYYGACDLYVTASLWEGFDMPAVEAQSCGKKVVAFDVGSHPEVVKKGTLVREGNVKGFAAAVIKELKK
jgi:1,2-diacylglycerol 3-alpha-glucosyltransferase